MKYANYHGYTDVRPYEIVRVVSDKTIEIRHMKVDRDPNWKPEMQLGGFSAHCTNQYDQTWIINSDPTAAVIRIRKRKNGNWYSKYGRHVIADKPINFYDYNF